jgi:phosphate transport system substrate-binding protein
MSKVNRNSRPIMLGFVTAMMLLTVMAPASVLTKAFAQTSITINGAGSTFVFPLMDTWRVQYNKLHPDVSFNYQSIGSGGGIKQLFSKTVDFGASDAPLSASQTSSAPAPVVHIPESIGSVAVIYNIPEIPNSGLKLTGQVLGNIFLGSITKWDDPQIKALNPNLQLPSQDIVTIHRSEGSGTTFIWTSYLSKHNSDWNTKVGSGIQVQWPVGIGATGSEGVANTLKGTPYSIAYVELNYALENKMTTASLQNSAGNFVAPTLDSTKAAVAASGGNLPAGDQPWSSVSMLDAPGQNAYPIASFTYIIVYKDLAIDPNLDQGKAQALVSFLSWAVTDGQQYSGALSFVPLPDTVISHDLDTLKSLTYKGTSLSSAVVPEFPLAAVLVMAAAVATTVGVTTYAKHNGTRSF